MEKKFYNTKQENFIQKAAASRSEEDKSPNRDQDQGNNERQLPQTEVLDDLAVVPSNLQAISQVQVESTVLTNNERRRILQKLAAEYHKLVRDIEWHLPKEEPSSGIRLAAAASQNQPLSRYRDLGGQQEDYQEASHRSIGFVDLFRQRMYFDRLGIPLTTLELIYMGDSEREWRRAQGQEQDQDQDNEYSINECVKCHDICTQTDLDDEGSDGDGRLHGGYQLPTTQAPELQSKLSCACFDCVQRKRDQESFHPTNNSNKLTKLASKNRRSDWRSSDRNYNASSERSDSKSSNSNAQNSMPESESQSRNRNRNRGHDKSDTYDRHFFRYQAEERNNRISQRESEPPPPPPPPFMPPPSRKYPTPLVATSSPPPPPPSLMAPLSRKYAGPPPPPPPALRPPSPPPPPRPVSPSVTNLKGHKDRKGHKDHRDRNKLDCRESLPNLQKQESYGYNHRYVSCSRDLESVSGEIQDFAVCRKPKIINIPGEVAAQSRDRDFRPGMGDGVELLKTPRTSRVPEDREVSVLLAAEHTDVISSASQAETSTETEKTVSTGSFLSDRTVDSASILNDVWYNPRAFEKTTKEEAAKRADVLEYNPINMLDSGYKGAPILDGDAAQLARDRSDYFARRFEKLTNEERAHEIVLRLRQLQVFQEKASHTFYQKLKFHNGRKQGPGKPSATKISSVLHSCPMLMKGCPRLISEALLSHFLDVHFNEPGMVLSEVAEHDKLLIKFKPATFKRSRNVCLSMIVHAGFKNLSFAPSVLDDMPFYNACLPAQFGRFTEHLPIFVMACRTRLQVKKVDDDRRKRRSSDQSKSDQAHLNELFASDSLFETSSETTIKSTEISGRASVKEFPGDEIGENVMALWMVSVELQQPIYVHMTVFNQRMDVCRTSIMQVRSLNSSHRVEKFLPKSKNFMRLTGQDLRVLTNNYQEPIYLEISIRQYKLPKCKAS